MIIILTLILIYISTEKNDIAKKYIQGVNTADEQIKFIKKIKNYFSEINIFLQKLNLKQISYIDLDNTNRKEMINSYLKKYKETNNYLNDELCEKIKNTKYFKKYKTILLEFFKFLYDNNIQYSPKNKIKEYYEIFEDKLNRDLNCCATIWNINLFFENLNKNFYIKLSS